MVIIIAYAGFSRIRFRYFFQFLISTAFTPRFLQILNHFELHGPSQAVI